MTNPDAPATQAQIQALVNQTQAVAVALLTLARALDEEKALRVDYQRLLVPMLRDVVADYNMAPEERRLLLGIA